MRKNHKIRPSSIESNYDRIYINRPDLPEGQYVNTLLKTIYINMAAPIAPEAHEKRQRRR